MSGFMFSENLLSRSIQGSSSNTNIGSSSSDDSPNVNRNDTNNGSASSSSNLPRLITPNPVPIRTSQQQELIDQQNRTILEQAERIRLLERNNNNTNTSSNTVGDTVLPNQNNNEQLPNLNRVGTGNTNNNVNPFTQLYNHSSLNNHNTLDEIKKEKVADKYYSMINTLVELDYNREDLEELELDELVNLYSSHHCKLEQIVKNPESKNFKERVNYLMSKFHDVLNKANKYHLMFNGENKDITSENLKLQYTLNAYIGRLNIHHLNITDSVTKAEITELTVYLCMIRNTAMDQGIKENNMEIGNNAVKSYISGNIGESLMSKDFKKSRKEIKDSTFWENNKKQKRYSSPHNSEQIKRKHQDNKEYRSINRGDNFNYRHKKPHQSSSNNNSNSNGSNYYKGNKKQNKGSNSNYTNNNRND